MGAEGFRVRDKGVPRFCVFWPGRKLQTENVLAGTAEFVWHVENTCESKKQTKLKNVYTSFQSSVLQEDNGERYRCRNWLRVERKLNSSIQDMSRCLTMKALGTQSWLRKRDAEHRQKRDDAGLEAKSQKCLSVIKGNQWARQPDVEAVEAMRGA